MQTNWKLDVFDECVKINKIADNALAIKKLLELAKYCEENNIEQIEIMNHLLRSKELYSYMKGKMTWQDEFARNCATISGLNEMPELEAAQNLLEGSKYEEQERTPHEDA